MPFDCVQVNTGLGFHWICNSEKKGGYMWIDDVINLELFFSFWPVGRFWLVNTYQYGWHPSVLSHRSFGTVECDESYSNEGDRIWSSGCGELFYRKSYCDENIVMTIYGFQIFCGVSSGRWGYALIWHMGGAYPYMATPQHHWFLGWLKCPLPYYWRWHHWHHIVI
jgi:hypothetical protein